MPDQERILSGFVGSGCDLHVNDEMAATIDPGTFFMSIEKNYVEAF